MRHGGSCLLEI